MIRFLAVAIFILTLLAPAGEAGLFSRKKKAAPMRYGVSRAEQQKRTEKALLQRQKNRDKQKHPEAAPNRNKTKSIEIRPKSSPMNEDH
jgi:hypothetical protein